jgi:proline iminopeptidase
MLGKILLWGGVALLVIIVAVAALGWWVYRRMTGPMYVPGALASLSSLDPPAEQDDPTAWRVEPAIRLHRFGVGEGERAALFVHGGPGFPTREPMAWLAALGDEATIHFYDQRGCGDSTRPFDRFESSNVWANMKQLEGALGLGAQIADIERIRRLLGRERLVLIGHSFGGFLAALYAAEFPDRVEKLVLLAPADMLVMPAANDGLFGLVRERLPGPRRQSFDRFLESYLDFGSLFAEDEAALARRQVELGNYILEAMGEPAVPVPEPGAPSEAGGWMVYAMYLSMGKRHDYSEALRRVTAPTLVVGGDDDLQPAAVDDAYARLIPNAERLTVSGAGHFFAGDQPELRRRAREFLGLEAAPGS